MRSTKGLFNLVMMSALLATARQGWAQADPVAPSLGGAANAIGQRPGGRTRAYTALSSGINHYRKKDYEAAAKLLGTAQRGQEYLSPQHRQELSRYLLLNKTAVQAQREGLERLAKAEEAVKGGQVQEAERLLKALEGNQFLSIKDRQKAQQLASKLRPIAPASASVNQADKLAQITLARAKLVQARQLLNKGDFKTAETMAIETAKMPNVYYDTNEDTPKKVMDDITRIKKDGKSLLRLSRNALSQGNLDKAEEMAQMAKEAGAGRRLFSFLGDNPDKVLRDIQAARMQKPTSAPEPKPNTGVAQPTEKPSRFEIFKNLNPFNRDRATPEMPPTIVEEPKTDTPKDQSRRFPLLPAFLTGRNKEEDDKIKQVAFNKEEESRPKSPYASRTKPTKLPEPPGTVKKPDTLPEPPGRLVPIANAPKLAKAPTRNSSTKPTKLPEPPDTKAAQTANRKLPTPPGSRKPTKLPEPPDTRVAQASHTQGKLPTTPASRKPTKLPEPPEDKVAQATPNRFGFLPFGRRAKPTTLPEPPQGAVANGNRVIQPVSHRETTTSSTRERTENIARNMLESARAALEKGDVNRAKNILARARNLNVRYNWWEDTPDKVAADIARAETSPRHVGTAVAQRSNPAVGTRPPPGRVTDKPKREYTRDDAKEMLVRARKLLGAARLDEAQQLATRAKVIAPSGWGLFEDSPDKVVQDVHKAQVRQNKAESIRLLAEARQHLDRGQLDDARSKALKAERLHGPYSIWDFGDRPQKLMTEIEVAKAKQRKKPETGDTRIAQGPKPTVKPTTEPKDGSSPYGQSTVPKSDKPIQLVEARQMLDQARNAMDKGDFDTALRLANRVEQLGFNPNQPDEISPAYIRKQVEIAQAKAKTENRVKQQAVQLLADARDLQRDNKLLEARQKVLAAQVLGAKFEAGDDRPERVLLDLAGIAVKRIEFHTQLASDRMAMASVDKSALEQAEQELSKAHALAAGFALDTQPIDQKLASIKQMRNGTAIAGVYNPPTPPNPPGRATVQDPPVAIGSAEPSTPSPEQEGLELLKKSRLELRRGETVVARRLAEDVFNGPYGLRNAAQDLIRSIDAEEHNQRGLLAKRYFEAMKSAYLRKEFEQAAAIGKTIDMDRLDPATQVRYKEIMTMPEMQHALVNGGTAPASTQMANVKPVGAGQATASDLPPTPAPPKRMTPAESYAKQVAAMQEIKFQKLRNDSLQAQREAIERFRAGSTDEALEMLRRYLLSLEETDLETSRVALLRKPIEARLEQFKTLKIQHELASLRDREGKTADEVRDRLYKAEADKKKNVGALMAEYKKFYKEGKYRDAQMAAMKAHELDPDNVAADAATHIAEIMANQVRYDEIKRRKRSMLVDVLDDVDDPGLYATDAKPLVFDKERTLAIQKRKGYDGFEIGRKKSPKELEIERSLSQPISFDFNNVTLFDAVNELHNLTGINIVPDKSAISEAGIRLDTPLSLRLESVSLKSALNLLLGQSHLTYIIKDEVLQITTPQKARGKQTQKTYQVADLVVPIENFTLSKGQNLQDTLDGLGQNSGLQNGLGNRGVTPFNGGRGLQGGQPVGSPGDSSYQPSASAVDSAISPGAVPRKPGESLHDALIKLITNTIEPHSWSDMGGSGTIDYYPLGMALVINQTPDIQEQVQELLNALRRLQDVEVAIEVRFISLSESFYERIGVDFLMEIQPDTTKFEPQITSGVFAPPGYVNAFSPTNFVAGISPAGTAPNQSLPAFTHDLDIPIKATSFAPSVPPFGGFPLAPGADGGLSLGLAFLSDIQVFLFLEAAQGDVRTNIMQAPKLTMFNAQTATITINDTNFFVTGNIIGLFNGQVVFNPQNTPFPLGVTMTLQPVVSADRRFVRVSLAPTLTNLTTPVAALFPFTTIVTPVFDTGVVGQPIPITQFIQQPSFTTVGVQTTVSVPDGGTVLLGGLKTLREGRNEFGPPILSKLPYINRLFKNVGYGRDVASHLIMVTPRIIINEEEQELQTGVQPSGN